MIFISTLSALKNVSWNSNMASMHFTSSLTDGGNTLQVQ